MSKRALLLLNRDAGQAATADNPVEMLRDLGIKVLVVNKQDNDSISDIIRRHKDAIDLVVLGGGDGTLNAAIEGLIAAQRPLGIIPLGTANDLARTLGIPPGIADCCQIIASGHTRTVDVGEVNGQYFLNVASMKLSVEITRALTKDIKRNWGVWGYVKTAIQVLYRARPFRAEIQSGQEICQVRTVQVAVGNGRHYGGGMTVGEQAEIDDQQLDLYSLEVQYWWQIVGLLRRLRSGRLAGSKYARTLRGSSFTIRTAHVQPINTDGEITTQTPATFRVIANALTLFVAPTSSGGQ